MTGTLESLITTIKGLPGIKQRGVAAIIGATVADAATRPFHWVYKQETLDSIIKKSTTALEFWPESQSPFYTLPLGLTSSYNDVMQVSLMSLRDNNGDVNIQDICESIKRKFGEGTQYHDAYLQRKALYDPTNRSAFPGPVEGPWIHSAVLKFLENYSTKKNGPFGDDENQENDGFCLILPIITLKAEVKDLWNTASSIASLLSTRESTTKMFHLMAIMLSGYVQGLPDPIKHMKEQIETFYPEFITILNDVEENRNLDYISTVAKYGKACSLPGSFIGSYLTMLNTDSYVDAVRMNITAGGCNCSRANIIGCCFGAKYGIDSIPVEWMRKVSGIESIIEAAISVVDIEFS